MNFLFDLMSSAPNKAGKMLSKLTIDPSFQNSNGTFIKVNGKAIKSNAYSHDTGVQEKLWMVTEEVVR